MAAFGDALWFIHANPYRGFVAPRLELARIPGSFFFEALRRGQPGALLALEAAGAALAISGGRRGLRALLAPVATSFLLLTFLDIGRSPTWLDSRYLVTVGAGAGAARGGRARRGARGLPASRPARAPRALRGRGGGQLFWYWRLAGAGAWPGAAASAVPFALAALLWRSGARRGPRWRRSSCCPWPAAPPGAQAHHRPESVTAPGAAAAGAAPGDSSVPDLPAARAPRYQSIVPRDVPPARAGQEVAHDRPHAGPLDAGERVPSRSGRAGDVFDPARGEVIRRAPFASAGEVGAAVAAAKAAFPGWRDTPPLRRARILARFRELLEARRDELARLVSEEHGKTLPDAAGSVQRGIEVVEFVCGVPHLLKGERAEDVGRGLDCHSALPAARGLRAASPLQLPRHGAALDVPGGDRLREHLVLKPSEKVPSTALRMAELLAEAGLPAGVLNVVPGDRRRWTRSSPTPTSPPSRSWARRRWRATSTRRPRGAGSACRRSAAPRTTRWCSPTRTSASRPTRWSGPAMAPRASAAWPSRRWWRWARPATRWSPRSRAGPDLPVGPGDRPGVEMGPVISAPHRERIRGFLEAGVAEGARLVVDGRRHEIEGAGKGFFIGPSLFDQVTPAMSIYREDIFGPVLVVLRADTLDQAIDS